MQIRRTKLNSVFTEQATNAVSDALNVRDYDFMILQIGTAASTDGKLQVRGSAGSAVNLGAAQSPTNIWDYQYLFDLNTGTGITGTTGVSPAGAITKEYKVNVDGLQKIAIEITGRTAGNYTVNLYGVTINGH